MPVARLGTPTARMSSCSSTARSRRRFRRASPSTGAPARRSSSRSSGCASIRSPSTAPTASSSPARTRTRRGRASPASCTSSSRARRRHGRGGARLPERRSTSRSREVEPTTGRAPGLTPTSRRSTSPTSTPRSTSSRRRRASGTRSSRSAPGGPSFRPTSAPGAGARRALGRARRLLRVAESLPHVTSGADVAFLALRSSSRPSSGSSASRCRSGTRAACSSAGLGSSCSRSLLEVAGFEVAANFAKLAAVTRSRFWFLDLFERVGLGRARRAASIPSSTSFSVWRGPTGHIVEEQPRSSTTLSFAFPVPGGSPAQLGLPDLLFFALFLAAAARWASASLTWLAMAALLRRDDRPGRRRRPSTGLPALPLLSLGFLLPNADILWRRLRAADARGRSTEREPAAVVRAGDRLDVRRVREHVHRSRALEPVAPLGRAA